MKSPKLPIADTFDDRAVHVMMEAVDGRFWDRASHHSHVPARSE